MLVRGTTWQHRHLVDPDPIEASRDSVSSNLRDGSAPTTTFNIPLFLTQGVSSDTCTASTPCQTQKERLQTRQTLRTHLPTRKNQENRARRLLNQGNLPPPTGPAGSTAMRQTETLEV